VRIQVIFVFSRFLLEFPVFVAGAASDYAIKLFARNEIQLSSKISAEHAEERNRCFYRDIIGWVSLKLMLRFEGI